MEEQATATPKKTIRTRKTAVQPAPTPETRVSVTSSSSTTIIQVFDDLMSKVIQSKQEFDNLQKEMLQTKQDWSREQKEHDLELTQRNAQEELERKREQETYQYNTNLTRKRVEDEFEDKKLAWEKDLAQRKEELDEQRKELEELRKQVSSFDSQKDQAVKETQALVEKQLTEQFDQERKLREQEVKSEKEIMGIKISNLEAENSRLNKEMEVLKRSLDEATRQVKEIAVKVIESGQPKTQPSQEP